MNWFYADGGKQQGPIDEAQLVALIQSGKITQETLIWREGMPGWLPFRLARAAMPPPVPPAPAPEAARPTTAPASPVPDVIAAVPPQESGTPFAGTTEERVACNECGGSFSKHQTVQYGTVTVCTTCKPGFLDRVMARAVSADAASSTITEEQLLAREYKIDIGTCLERAWAMFTENPGTMLMGALIMAPIVALLILNNLLSLFAPPIGFLLGLAYAGPMVGGYLWFLLRLARKQNVSAADVFSGFSRRGLHLFLVAILQFVAVVICTIPSLGILAATGATAVIQTIASGGKPEIAGLQVLFGLMLAGLTMMILVSYVTTLWTHALLLVIDKGYSFWPAMELSRKIVLKRWWMTFLFIFVAGLISFLGVCACGFGLLITVPLQFAMKAYLFEDNFSDLAPASRDD